MAYWDTSCLVKLYAWEPDSAAIRGLAVSGDVVVTSAIARFELWATLSRKEATGDLETNGARQAIASYDADVGLGLIQVEAISQSIAAQFESIIEHCNRLTPPLLLRTLDAIHLSTAETAGEFELVCTDRRLRQAAVGLGFSIFPPS